VKFKKLHAKKAIAKIMTSRGFAPGGMTLHLEEIGKMTTGHSVTTPWIKLH